MKKSKSELRDWLRPEYKRSDFGEFVRGKYADRVRTSTNVVVLDPQVARVFPNDEAVNAALRGLMRLGRSSGSPNIAFNPGARQSGPRRLTRRLGAEEARYVEITEDVRITVRLVRLLVRPWVLIWPQRSL